MEVACDTELIKDPETRRANILYVASHIEDSLAVKRNKRIDHSCLLRCITLTSKCCCVWFGKRQGNCLIVLYLITKLLYIVNVVAQFLLMTKFLGTSYTFYGLDVLRDLALGNTWEESGNFPRITLCDFEIRQLANKHRYTVQCVLPINMFNEKIYIFLWFWCLTVGVVSTSSFLQWTVKSSFHAIRMDFVRKFLKLRGVLEPGDKQRLLAFVDQFLRQDGVFILRLICTNVGELVASEVTERLWLLFTAHPLGAKTSAGQNVECGKKSTHQAHSSRRPAPPQQEHSVITELGKRPPAPPPQHSNTPKSSVGRRRPVAPNKPAKTSEFKNMDEDPGEVV